MRLYYRKEPFVEVIVASLGKRDMERLIDNRMTIASSGQIKGNGGLLYISQHPYRMKGSAEPIVMIKTSSDIDVSIPIDADRHYMLNLHDKKFWISDALGKVMDKMVSFDINLRS